MKDRYAATVQYFTIHNGPRRGLHHQRITVTYLGQVARAFTSTDIRANRFQLCLRGLTAEEVTTAKRALDEVRRDGMPNYFDDQRCRLLALGRFEEALRLALTNPYEFDRAEQKREKRVIAKHWGEWPEMYNSLPRGHARDLAGYLAAHRADFRGAFVRLRPEMRGLYLSVYQSDLWNRMLARWLREQMRPEQLLTVSLRLGPVPMHRMIDDRQRQLLAELLLPLPSTRMTLASDDPRMKFVQSVLAEEGLEVGQLRVKGVRELFFSRGERPAVCVPNGLEWREEADTRNAGKRALRLQFELPRGAYATLIVKRVTLRPRGLHDWPAGLGEEV
jgi:tRNA pseudouridine13 synthase